MSNTENSPFPPGFFWGASNAAHQVEGNNQNEWSEWEKRNADRLAHNPYERLTAQSRIFATAPPRWEDVRACAEKPSNYISGKASNHYELFNEDFDIARKLNHNAHRFSIEWSRVQPSQGVFDKQEIDHYRQVIRSLKDKKIDPFVTLWHFTNPLWIAEAGGWNNPNTKFHFARYVQQIVSEFQDDVHYWITINEPQIYSSAAFLAGITPPQRKNPLAYLNVLSQLQQAHQLAYQTIKKINPKLQVGFTKNNIYFEPVSSQFDKLMAHLLRAWWNSYFVDQANRSTDFIGLNYYFHNRVHYGINKNDNEKISDLGWELYPQGIYPALLELKKYNKPIFVTENGLADQKDQYRAWFIEEVIKSLGQAIRSGVNLQGYFHWSLIDNFEWDKGFWPRFGLIEIDYETMARKIRPSAYRYAELIQDSTTR